MMTAKGFEIVEKPKTFDWRKLIKPAYVGLWILWCAVSGSFIALATTPSKGLSFGAYWMMIGLAVLAIFGLITWRVTKGMDAK